MSQEEKDSNSSRDIEEELKKIKGKSWYEAEEEYRANTGRKSLTRIIFTALVHQNLNESEEIIKNTTEIASNIYDFFIEFDNYNDGDEVSKLYGGVALVSNEETMRKDLSLVAAFGFLEMDTPVAAIDCFRKLKENESELCLATTRILLVTDDCPCNEFGEFGVYLTIPPTEDQVDIEKEGSVTSFKNIMKHLCKQSMNFPSEAKIYGNNTNIKVLSGIQSRSIPSSLRVIGCAKCDSYPTLEEYLEIFDPENIPLDLESENLSPKLEGIDWKAVYDIAMSCYGADKKEPGGKQPEAQPSLTH